LRVEEYIGKIWKKKNNCDALGGGGNQKTIKTRRNDRNPTRTAHGYSYQSDTACRPAEDKKKIQHSCDPYRHDERFGNPQSSYTLQDKKRVVKA
jgi:hypothetical protein